MSSEFIRFFRTSADCQAGDVAYPGVPVFFDATGIIEHATAFMIHMRITEGRPASTVATYAYHLQKFFKHIKQIDTDWKAVTDGMLVGWRDVMLQKDNLLAGTVAGYLMTVFRFYQWAEEEKRLKYVVAIYGECEREACSCRARVYQISARQNERGWGWTWPYLPKAPSSTSRNTPTVRELERVHQLAFDSTTGQRDSLLISFYEDLCLRRDEATRIQVADVPCWDKIDDASDGDKTFTIKVLGKGGKSRYVPVLPDLMANARDYIEERRSQIIEKVAARDSTFEDSGFLFIGETTGKPMSKEHVSRRVSALLSEAGVERASGHRIRATGLTSLAEAYDGVDENGAPLPKQHVLFKVQERAGHSNWQSLEPYLNHARSPAPHSPQAKLVDASAKLRDVERQIARRASELAHLDGLGVIAVALRAGRHEEASRALTAMLDRSLNEPCG